MGNLEIVGQPSCRIAMVVILILCAVIAAGPIAAQTGDESPPIRIRGSSNLQPLADSWVSAYRPAVETPTFDVQPNGSSRGVEDLLAGLADIAMASRPLTEEETAIAHDKGLSIRNTVVARMGIAVVVNSENPVSSVAVGDLAKIFSGEMRNWQQVGGPDEPITVVRKVSGWSPDFFRRRIMGDKDFIADAVTVDSKEEVVAEVVDRVWSIGFTGMPEAMPALGQLSLLRLISESSDEDSTYALSRPLFFFSIQGSAPVEHFLDFVTSAEAQQLIEATGFYPAQQADGMATE